MKNRYSEVRSQNTEEITHFSTSEFFTRYDSRYKILF